MALRKHLNGQVKLTGISVSRIIQLAREIGNANHAWISQGWGLQRTENGEQACRSIMMATYYVRQHRSSRY
ncbi:Dimethyl sulfoxide reductase DmsA precursor [Providencia stuartii]|nr:Dimethyl sulfoxide reductase DmsA precursor [Providencia stuartii]